MTRRIQMFELYHLGLGVLCALVLFIGCAPPDNPAPDAGAPATNTTQDVGAAETDETYQPVNAEVDADVNPAADETAGVNQTDPAMRGRITVEVDSEEGIDVKVRGRAENLESVDVSQ